MREKHADGRAAVGAATDLNARRDAPLRSILDLMIEGGESHTGKRKSADNRLGESTHAHRLHKNKKPNMEEK